MVICHDRSPLPERARWHLPNTTTARGLALAVVLRSARRNYRRLGAHPLAAIQALLTQAYLAFACAGPLFRQSFGFKQDRSAASRRDAPVSTASSTRSRRS